MTVDHISSNTRDILVLEGTITSARLLRLFTHSNYETDTFRVPTQGASAVFVNGARFLVPFRLAAALALAPVVERTFFVKEGKDGKEAKEGKDDE